MHNVNTRWPDACCMLRVGLRVACWSFVLYRLLLRLFVSLSAASLVFFSFLSEFKMTDFDNFTNS